MAFTLASAVILGRIIIAVWFEDAPRPIVDGTARPRVGPVSSQDLPLYWGRLPAPTVPVQVQTSSGTFRVPMGYLSGWFSLKAQPEVKAPDGLRRFSVEHLGFQFEHPGGGISLNPQWAEAVRDEKGAVVPGRTTVFVMSVEPPKARTVNHEVDVLATGTQGSLAEDPLYSRGEQKMLVGVVPPSNAGGRIGVRLSCHVNCLFSFYLEDEGLEMNGVMDGAFRRDGLAIAEQARALYDGWKG